ncbi:MAG: hypothetical protein AAF581_18150 [Planctomycetota bacterium]
MTRIQHERAAAFVTRRLLLLGLGIWLFGGVSCLPVRVVHVTREQRAAELIEQAQQAQLAGDRGAAFAHYRDAAELAPQQLATWRSLCRVARPADREPLRVLLTEWAQDDRGSAKPAFVLAWLFPAEREQHLREAWRLAPVPQSPVLDSDLVGLGSTAAWRDYSRLLQQLAPRTPALEFRTVWTLLQLGAREAAQEHLQRVDCGAWQRPARAAVALARGDAGGALRHNPTPQTAEGAVVALRAWLGLAATTAAAAPADALSVDELLSQWSGKPAVALVGAAFDAKRGRGSVARDTLVRLLSSESLSPSARVEAAWLLHQLSPDASSAVRDTLLAAAQWAPSLGGVARLEAALVERHEFVAAASVAAKKLQLDPHHAKAAEWRWRREAMMTIDPELLAANTPLLLGSGTPSAVRAEFRSLSATVQENVVTALCRHPDAVRRVIALQELRERALLPIEKVPDLRADPDARVRGAWIALMAAAGDERRREALELGRADRDPYVRELAERLGHR